MFKKPASGPRLRADDAVELHQGQLSRGADQQAADARAGQAGLSQVSGAGARNLRRFKKRKALGCFRS